MLTEEVVEGGQVFAEARVLGAESSAQKSEALSCRTFHPAGASGEWKSRGRSLA